MAIPKDDQSAFDDLPTFDARKFEPPAWASGPDFQWGQAKNGESSKSHHGSSAQNGDDMRYREHIDRDLEEDEDEEVEEDEEDVWEDARSVVEPDEAKFTVSELRELLSRATKYKAEGNAQFTARPPTYQDAVRAYESAIDHLPSCPRNDDDAGKSAKSEKPGIEEVTEEEAAEIQAENEKELSAEEKERQDVEEEIRELTKACWGNLAACHIALKDDKSAVKACDSALEIDKDYTKALHRRATANERIGSATALSSAQEDYKALLRLLPPSSPQLAAIRRSLATLPGRLQEQQQKEMSDALGQLKDLGNKFLGSFGLNTDMFRMDKAPDGSYSMKFGN